MSTPMEWIEIPQGEFTVWFGHTDGDPKLYFRVLGEKADTKAHIRWSLDAAWMRDVLVRWFPPDSVRNQPAPRSGT